MDILNFNEISKKFQTDLAINISKFSSVDDITVSFKIADKYGVTGKVLSLLCYCDGITTSNIQNKKSMSDIVIDDSSITELTTSPIALRAIMNCPYTATLFSSSNKVFPILFNNKNAVFTISENVKYVNCFIKSSQYITYFGGCLIPYLYDGKYYIVLSDRAMETKSSLSTTFQNLVPLPDDRNDGLSNCNIMSYLSGVSSVLGYNGYGYDDWYIPAINELQHILMYMGVIQPIWSGFGYYSSPPTNMEYLVRQWSSTDAAFNGQFYQLGGFVNNVTWSGTEYRASMNSSCNIRPIRRVVPTII